MQLQCTYIYKMKLCNHFTHVYVFHWEEFNISITRMTMVNNICFCHVAISDDISTHADFQVDGYHGC